MVDISNNDGTSYGFCAVRKCMAVFMNELFDNVTVMTQLSILSTMIVEDKNKRHVHMLNSETKE